METLVFATSNWILIRRRGRLERPAADHGSYWTSLSTIAALLASLFAGWAAWETRSSALEAARATRAAVWMQMISEYESAETLSAMKGLRAWREQHPRDAGPAFEHLLTEKNPSAEDEALGNKVDADRRRLIGFFGKILTLDRMGVVTESEIALSWDRVTYRYVAEVLLPIQSAKTDAMLHAGWITKEQKKSSEDGDRQLLRFYERIARDHDLIASVTPP